jgi:hypothetical protein
MNDDIRAEEVIRQVIQTLNEYLYGDNLYQIQEIVAINNGVDSDYPKNKEPYILQEVRRYLGDSLFKGLIYNILEVDGFMYVGHNIRDLRYIKTIKECITSLLKNKDSRGEKMPYLAMHQLDKDYG